MSHQTQIQFYQGVESGIPTLASGEPGWSTDTKKLFLGDGAVNHQIGGSSGISIGDPVGSPTAFGVLYTDVSNDLAQDAQFTYTGSALTIAGGGGVGITLANNGFLQAASATENVLFATGFHAGSFGRAPYSLYVCSSVFSAVLAAADGTTAVNLCDGTYAVAVSAGNISFPGTAGNTLRFGTTSTTPSNTGTPANWVEINIGGSVYYLAAYQ